MIGNAQTVVDRLYAWMDEPKARRRMNTNRRPTSSSLLMGDCEIILRARNAKNGAKFIALFDHGDTSGYGGDESRADMALLAILGFYTQDPVQLDRLYRASALARAKWDEPHGAGGATYGEMTITKCLEGVTETYNPGRPTEDAEEIPVAAPLASDTVPEPVHLDDPADLQQRLAALEAENAALRAERDTLQAECAAWNALHDNRTLSRGAKDVLVWLIKRGGHRLGEVLPSIVVLGYLDETAKSFSPVGKSTFDAKMRELESRGFATHREGVSEKSGRPFYAWTLRGQAINAAWATLGTEQPPEPTAEEIAAKEAAKARRRQERAVGKTKVERLQEEVRRQRQDEITVAAVLKDRDATIDQLESQLHSVILQLDDYRKEVPSTLACVDCGTAIDPATVRCGPCQGILPDSGSIPTGDMLPKTGNIPPRGHGATDDDLLAGLDDALARVSALESDNIMLRGQVERLTEQAGDLRRLNALYAAKNGGLAMQLERATRRESGHMEASA